MKISARNVLKGKIKSIAHGTINSEIVIELAEGTEITSIITKKSAESLNLKEGSEVYAIVKASSVMIGID
jgi:molybdopterin-binding protein